MSDHRISSDESEGLFNEFIQEQLEDRLEDILNEGALDRLGDRSSDIIIEVDDIVPPVFAHGDEDGEGSGPGQGQGPGTKKGKLRFRVPFEAFMKLVAQKLRLPDLLKEGSGKIKEVSYTFKTFGPVGAVLDRKRTFKRALRSSIALGTYDPARDRLAVQVRRRDRRYKVPQRVEKPRYRAVVFYMGDISYSTHGVRLELEKRLVNFIHQWLDFNYGLGSVEHRFFVHDAEAYEVSSDDFYKVSNAGGTFASTVFELVSQVAFNEYDVRTTNCYGFYFGDGEVFEEDASRIVSLLGGDMQARFNRLGIVEVRPGQFSYLKREVEKEFQDHPVIRVGALKEKAETVEVIQALFEERNA